MILGVLLCVLGMSLVLVSPFFALWSKWTEIPFRFSSTFLIAVGFVAIVSAGSLLFSYGLSIS